jgi:serine/threonine-protein kinase
MPEVPLIATRYRVLRELGRGGMGVVYVVEHIRTGDHLALKLLHGHAAQDPQSIERFKREARASARIKSEHVVKVLDADVAPELENAPFLVMELLDGSDLEKRVRTRGPLSADHVLQYLGQAARALDKSHAAGIVHRDLKPENLFVHRREDGSTVLKILDFGISKIVGGDAAIAMSGAGMTSTGAVMGTPLYMAPEQARGRVSEIGPATDIWAIGLIALYLLTGEIYWRAQTVPELMAQILTEPLYAPTQRWRWLPQGIDPWFTRSCSRDPKQRFPSVGQQIAALGTVLGQTVTAEAGPEPPAPWSPAQAASPAGTVRNPMVSAIIGGSTTAATAHEAAQESLRRSRLPLFAALAVVVLAGAGTTVWMLPKRSDGPGAAANSANLAAAAAVMSTASASLSLATAPPSSPATVASAAASAPAALVTSGVEPAASSAPTTSGAARSGPPHPVHGNAGVHSPSPAQPEPPPTSRAPTVTHAPSSQASTSTPFNPSAP